MVEISRSLTYIEGKGYEGVVYCYENTNTSMKYIGCTPREEERKSSWNRWGNAYSGAKIAKARKESQPEDWTYFVIEKHYSFDLVELEHVLEERESYYINAYDSYEN